MLLNFSLWKEIRISGLLFLDWYQNNQTYVYSFSILTDFLLLCDVVFIDSFVFNVNYVNYDLKIYYWFIFNSLIHFANEYSYLLFVLFYSWFLQDALQFVIKTFSSCNVDIDHLNQISWEFHFWYSIGYHCINQVEINLSLLVINC